MTPEATPAASLTSVRVRRRSQPRMPSGKPGDLTADELAALVVEPRLPREPAGTVILLPAQPSEAEASRAEPAIAPEEMQELLAEAEPLDLTLLTYTEEPVTVETPEPEPAALLLPLPVLQDSEGWEAFAANDHAVAADPVDADLVDADSMDADPVDAEAADAKTAEAEVAEAETIDDELAEVEAAEAESADAELTEAEPAEAETADAELAEAEAAEVDAVDAEAAADGEAADASEAMEAADEDILDYWDSLRGGRDFPALDELDRTHVAATWPNTLLLAVDSADLPRITRLGASDGEIDYTATVVDWIMSRGKQSAKHAEPMEEERRFAVSTGGARYRLLLLPLSSYGLNCDHVLCQLSRLPELGAVASIKRWFAS